MSGFVYVVENDNEEGVDVPVEDDGTVLISSVRSQFAEASGLKYRSNNRWAAVRATEGRFYPPIITDSSDRKVWGDNIPYTVVGRRSRSPSPAPRSQTPEQGIYDGHRRGSRSRSPEPADATPPATPTQGRRSRSPGPAEATPPATPTQERRSRSPGPAETTPPATPTQGRRSRSPGPADATPPATPTQGRRSRSPGPRSATPEGGHGIPKRKRSRSPFNFFRRSWSSSPKPPENDESSNVTRQSSAPSPSPGGESPGEMRSKPQGNHLESGMDDFRNDLTLSVVNRMSSQLETVDYDSPQQAAKVVDEAKANLQEGIRRLSGGFEVSNLSTMAEGLRRSGEELFPTTPAPLQAKPRPEKKKCTLL